MYAQKKKGKSNFVHIEYRKNDRQLCHEALSRQAFEADDILARRRKIDGK